MPRSTRRAGRHRRRLACAMRCGCRDPRLGTTRQQRAFFEEAFTPLRAANNENGEALFTGYYEAEAARLSTPRGPFMTPLLKRPPISSWWSRLFRPAWRGERIAPGRGRPVKPYDSRTRSSVAACEPQARALWSTIRSTPSSSRSRARAASSCPTAPSPASAMTGQNGHPYVPIGPRPQSSAARCRSEESRCSRSALGLLPSSEHGAHVPKSTYVFFLGDSGDGPIRARACHHPARIGPP